MSHYDVLGVKPNATQAEIQAAYERLAGASNFDPGRPGATESSKIVVKAYYVLRDPALRKEYDARLDWRQSPVKDGAVTEQEFRSGLEAGRASEETEAKVEAKRLRRHKEEREKEQKVLGEMQRSDDAMYSAWWLIRIISIAIFSAGALWFLVTMVRYFWTHPLF